MTTAPVYCSIATLAEKLDCCDTTVRDYVNRGLLPQPKRIGGLVRWKWEDVVKVMDGLDECSEEHSDPILQAINGG